MESQTIKEIKEIKITPINAKKFAPFGDIIALKDRPDRLINQDLCGRHHDLAKLDFGPDGRAGISLFDAQPRPLPYRLDMMERHPLGSQAFLPLHENPFLVIVAEDEDDRPQYPHAFITQAGMGINYHKNIWHGVLTPLRSPGLFAVIDRIGDGNNLEEHWFDQNYEVIDISGYNDHTF